MSNRSSSVDDYPERPRWAVLLAALLTMTAASPVVLADHGLPHPELLGRGTFVEDVSATFRVKGLDNSSQVLRMQDASDMVVLRITIEAGGIAPWHTHEGSGMLINLGPGIVTNVVGEDCEPRYYMPNEAFADLGQGELHAVRNDSLDEVVLLVVFFGIQGAPVIPSEEGPGGCDFL
jgi:hypothetical protein